jgi:hypothetical protein
MAIVLIQAYEPLPEIGGMSGILPCEAALADTLVQQCRAELVNPNAEPFRYCPGSRAYTAMLASRGRPGPVLIPADVPQPSPKRPRGRPAAVIA